MRLGVCWYPEQWPESTWVPDLQLMARTGLEVVRIGEFAWSRMEPRRDAWDLDWLARAVDAAADAGLDVVLGTPTATPPVWLMHEHPEILSVGPDGVRRAYGSRRHTCPTSARYRDEARRVVTAMRDRFGDHPAVVAWQVDNEPGNHDSARCWCDECQSAFTAWLRVRFDDDVDALNAAWGTAFWSMTYPTFEDVRLPVPTMTVHNPALRLAHLEFASHQVVDGLREQRDLLVGTGRPTFTNLYLGDVDVHGGDIARLHGMGAIDSYPHGVSGPDEVAFLLDLTVGSAAPVHESAGTGIADVGASSTVGRGTALEAKTIRDTRSWVVEQQPGPVNWTGTNHAVPPGQVRAWGRQAAAHGIDTLLFFRWRAARFGQEQYHTGLLRHDGTPDQGLAEARALFEDLAADPPPPYVPTVAVLHDHRDAWAVDLDPHVDGLTHRQLVVAAHTAARRHGRHVAVVQPDADLSLYDTILAPALHLATDHRVADLLFAAHHGTEVVVGVRSLTKDRHDAWVDVPAPAGLTDHVGMRVATWGNAAEPDGTAPTVRAGDRAVACGTWAETFEATDDATDAEVEVLATWEGTWRDGTPAAVRRGGVTLFGASSVDAWEVLLGRLWQAD